MASMGFNKGGFMTQENKNIIIQEGASHLDEIYEHTEYKIKYVKKYVEYWLYVVSNFEYIKNINFIDCMCNAGIYKNGVLGTPIEVLSLFIKFSIEYPTKKFNLFLNDSDANRVQIIKKMCNLLEYDEYSNLHIYFTNMDVNTYLDRLVNSSSYFGNNGYNQLSSTILFVDPYCFGEVKIKKIKNFTDTFYSELIFNYFNSDYRRNIDNTSTPTKRRKIIDSMTGILGYNPNMNEKQVEELIQKNIKGKYIKYSFSYPFRIKTNVELYHIIYATPNPKGLMKIKESLWDVFNGDTFFKNGFNDSEVKEMNVQNFSIEAQNLLVKQFCGQTISYKIICEYVLEHTMLKDSHIINYLLKPLINQCKIIKNNTNGKRNFKNDSYTFVKVENCQKI